MPHRGTCRRADCRRDSCSKAPRADTALPLDIPSIRVNISTKELVETIRKGRRKNERVEATPPTWYVLSSELAAGQPRRNETAYLVRPCEKSFVSCCPEQRPGFCRADSILEGPDSRGEPGRPGQFFSGPGTLPSATGCPHRAHLRPVTLWGDNGSSRITIRSVRG